MYRIKYTNSDGVSYLWPEKFTDVWRAEAMIKYLKKVKFPALIGCEMEVVKEEIIDFARD